MKNTITQVSPAQTFHIFGMDMVQLPSTSNSGLYKFKDVDTGLTYTYEASELPRYILKQLNPE